MDLVLQNKIALITGAAELIRQDWFKKLLLSFFILRSKAIIVDNETIIQ
ncbi:MAG: hypothetical protein ACOWWO_15740 [Peptococcaceae bacterium]